ncbi:PfkB family carbohydrate kinase [Umezawaea sp. Da 62-37]|uniref:PfkB family carbohydrate kinase n=1 Tax=Umezawaea sp. Da 62-37 TaxID=3075927 RepID=UPI0028F6CCF1|nr:PfkB family carbohydrate kinase [Umezawaea sp. Da 62-37]WNV91928.1 PfkB family carbohydrate kinase [Umezawaea sp. Da 62-37]
MLCVGLTTVDVSQRVAEFPAPGEKVQSTGVHMAPGGPAANAATAVAALGHRAVLLTALGRDAFGSFAAAGLAGRGVEFHDLAPESRISLSMVAVRERDGERTVISRNAAEVALPTTVDAVTPFVFQADVVLLDGHLGPLALAVATAAKDAGLQVVLDAGSWKPVLEDLLPLVDVAACSSAFGPTEDELHARGVPLVIRTNGANPVTWSSDGGLHERPVPVVQVRDTNGAGDVWHGALAVALARHDPVADAIGWANAVAAVRVRNTAQDWVEELARWQDSR